MRYIAAKGIQRTWLNGMNSILEQDKGVAEHEKGRPLFEETVSFENDRWMTIMLRNGDVETPPWIELELLDGGNSFGTSICGGPLDREFHFEDGDDRYVVLLMEQADRILYIREFGMIIRLNGRKMDGNSVMTVGWDKGTLMYSCLQERCLVCDDTACYGECEVSGSYAATIELADEIDSRREFNRMAGALESMVLEHAATGVDVLSQSYIKGVQKAIQVWHSG